ncbi:MAG: tetratricopeptide repeat protein [Deltaproteobacteria bacterium]|nr:tetratricopeptide repeat protein [Deltaproteobacteria bacterium]
MGRSIGFAYAINTIGAVSGAFCAGFILIPLVGKETGLSLVIGLQILTAAVIAGVVLTRKGRGGIRLAPLIVTVLAGLILCFYFPRWNRHLLAKGRYHIFDQITSDIKTSGWLEALWEGSEILAASGRGELVYYGEGIGGFTTVTTDTGPFGNMMYVMAISGKSDASSRRDMKTQTLCAHFPMLFHKDPEKVMVLGLASGVTAGEVLCYPVEQLDILEINRQVVAASAFFTPWNSHVLSNPKTNLIIQDGRAHLRLTRQQYDVIISEPSNPWMAGLAALFTRDYFALARDRLKGDGIFIQWIHAYQMDWQTFSLVGRTFGEIFPNSLLIGSTPSGSGHDDYLLVGFKDKATLNLDNAVKKISHLRKSKNISLSHPGLLYRLILSEDLKSLFGPGPVNTDDRPRLEFAAPKLIYRSDKTITRKVQVNKRLTPTTEDIVRQVTTDVDAQIDFAAYALSVYAPFQDMVDLSIATPSQKDRFLKLMDSYCAKNPVEKSDLKNDDLTERCHSIQIEALRHKIDQLPDRAASYAYLGFIHLSRGLLDQAITNYSHSLSIEPDNTTVHLNMGVALGMQGKLDESIAHYLEALRIRPDLEEAHNNLGVAYFHKGHIVLAIKHFRKALEIRPDYADAENNLKSALIYTGKGNE